MAEKATAKEEDPAEQQALAEGPAEDQTPTEAVVEAYEAKVRLPQYNVNARVLNIKIIKNNYIQLIYSYRMPDFWVERQRGLQCGGSCSSVSW